MDHQPSSSPGRSPTSRPARPTRSCRGRRPDRCLGLRVQHRQGPADHRRAEHHRPRGLRRRQPRVRRGLDRSPDRVVDRPTTPPRRPTPTGTTSAPTCPTATGTSARLLDLQPTRHPRRHQRRRHRRRRRRGDRRDPSLVSPDGVADLDFSDAVVAVGEVRRTCSRTATRPTARPTSSSPRFHSGAASPRRLDLREGGRQERRLRADGHHDRQRRRHHQRSHPPDVRLAGPQARRRHARLHPDR